MIDYKRDLKQQVATALHEDIGDQDITALLIAPELEAMAQVISREAAIICGQDWFNASFDQIDSAINIEWLVNDGDAVEKNQVLCRITGKARALLTAERTALNFLQTLSATATLTRLYVDSLSTFNTRILDTRKTIPGMRLAQKYAVHCGGGHNHRIGLFDAILIKENHIASSGSIKAAVSAAQDLQSGKMIEIEVEDLEQLQLALDAGVDRVLLDNMSIDMLSEAVSLTDHRAELEASGGIMLDNIKQIAATGVDFISVGALTKDIKALDLSMKILMNK